MTNEKSKKFLKLKFSEKLNEIERIYEEIEKELVGLGVVGIMIALCIATLFVKDGKKRCANLFLIIPKGGGKKEILENFAEKNKFALIPFSKGTASGLCELPLDTYDHKAWIVEDLISTVSTMSKASVDDFCAFLNELLEKGHYKKATSFSHADINGKVVCLFGMAIEQFNKHKRKWQNLTFLDRFIPFYFGYTSEEDEKIGKNIFDEEIKIPQIKLSLPKREKRIEWDKNLTGKALELARLLKQGRDSSYLARASIDIKKLTMASALLNKRTKVELEDLELIKSLVPYMINPYCFTSLTFKIIQFIREERREITSREIYDKFSEYGEKTIEYHLEQIRAQKFVDFRAEGREGVGGFRYIYFSKTS